MSQHNIKITLSVVKVGSDEPRLFTKGMSLGFVPSVGMKLGPMAWCLFEVYEVNYLFDYERVEVAAGHEVSDQDGLDHIVSTLLDGGWAELR